MSRVQVIPPTSFLQPTVRVHRASGCLCYLAFTRYIYLFSISFSPFPSRRQEDSHRLDRMFPLRAFALLTSMLYLVLLESTNRFAVVVDTMSVGPLHC